MTGTDLKAYREARGLTHEEMAAKLEIVRSMVRWYEQNPDAELPPRYVKRLEDLHEET